MSEIIARHPRVAEVDGRITAATEAERQYLRRCAEARGRFQRDLDAHSALVQEALATGGEAPESEPVPEIADADHFRAIDGFRNRLQELRDERVRVLAGIRPTIEQEAREQYDRALSEARKHVDALTAIAATVRDAQQAVLSAVQAQNSLDAGDPMRGWTTIDAPTPADPATLVQAITYDIDLLTVQVPRRLGWSGDSIHRLPDSGWEPPIPA